MSVYEKISGFADEISQDFDQQLKTVTDLGMKYICIRSAEHKGIADYTPEEVRTVLLPKLRAAGVGVSSLGTAIGKVEVDDEEGFAKQLEQLETLCETAKLLDCSFIRMFISFITKYYLNPRTVANESLFLIFLYFFSTPKVRLSSIEHKACIICSDETPTYFIVVSMLSCPNSFCICAKFTPSSNQWVARACRKLWQ